MDIALLPPDPPVIVRECVAIDLTQVERDLESIGLFLGPQAATNRDKGPGSIYGTVDS